MTRISTLFYRVVLVCISKPVLSRLWGRVMRLRRPRFIARAMIKRFQRHYRIDMDEFQGQARDYRSLADFFLRPLDPQKRPLKTDGQCLLSPADGRLSELELITEDEATQVKGWTYPLRLLLGEAPEFSKGWHVATIYLSPRDYHRFHYPIAGRITGSFHGGTQLFPVNDFSVNRVKDLYIRNERVVTRFTRQDSPFYVIAVGATFVGSIEMKYLHSGLPALGRWLELDMPAEQMAEMGHFAMGSTVILVIPANMVISVMAEKGKPIRLGDPLFKIRN